LADCTRSLGEQYRFEVLMAAQFSAAKERKDTVDVEEPLGKLKLSESKRQGVVLVKPDRESLPEVKWMAAARLLTVKNLSEQSLISTMKAAWKFRPIGKNLFVVQANCLGDWKRIMEEGPWLFRGGALMLEEYDGATVTPSVMPNRVQAWNTNSQATTPVPHGSDLKATCW